MQKLYRIYMSVKMNRPVKKGERIRVSSLSFSCRDGRCRPLCFQGEEHAPGKVPGTLDVCFYGLDGNLGIREDPARISGVSDIRIEGAPGLGAEYIQGLVLELKGKGAAPKCPEPADNVSFRLVKGLGGYTMFCKLGAGLSDKEKRGGRQA